MTPKEKADELVDKFIMNVLDYEGCSINDHKAKQCALVAVDEILKVASFYNDSQAEVTYWQEVKKEIENL